MKRRLAAILAADMVGYSRLMRADEVGTIARQKTCDGAIIEPNIATYGGRIVKKMGDGVLVEFPSVVAAVECAVAVQATLAADQAALSDDRRLRYRIGINLGDIVCDGDDILGDGVNVAARLEGLAEPGSICISDVVCQSVREKLDLAFDDLGEIAVKNIPAPVHAFRVRPRDSATPHVAGPMSGKPAVAVLPFDNLSGDADQDYFSDGLSEDIITLLSAWRCFPVIARNSSFAFKKRSRDIRAIARELAARYVIEGSVRKFGNRVRVTAQLIDAESGHHIWAKKFDSALQDIFDVQDEITQEIVGSVEPEMERAELRKATTARAASLSAWDLFLRGREHLHLLTPDENARARALFERATELDPHYSDAFAGLSLTYQRDILFDVAEDRAAWETKALASARRAVALDNESAYAHYALGSAHIWANQHAASIAETRMAVQLNPSNTVAWLALANRLDIVGDKEGMPLLEKTLQRNPRDPHNHIYYGQLGRCYINARDYEKALACLREAVRLNPDYPNTYHVLAICLGHLGKADEAREAARRCDALRPGLIARRAHWNVYLDEAANRHLTEGLRKAGLVA